MAYTDVSVTEAADDWEHLESCAACALLFFQHAWVAARMREHVRGTAATSPRRLEASPERKAWWTRPPRRAVAAALLVFVISAAALAVHLGRSRLLGTAGRLFDTVEEMERATGARFSELAIDPLLSVEDQVQFVGTDGRAATVACIALPRRTGLDLVAFGADGAPIWRASDAWGDDWTRTLGVADVSLWQMQTLVTRADADDTEETLYVLAQRGSRAGLFAVDPSTGALLGRAFLDGRLAPSGDTAQSLAVLPATEGERRRVLCAVQTDLDDAARPGLLLMDADARAIQQVRLPVIDENRGRHNRYTRFFDVDWGLQPPLVVAYTAEWVHVHLDYAGGRLDVASARVTTTDSTAQTFDGDYGTGSYLGGLPDEAAKIDELLAGVKDVPLDLPNGWGN